MSKHFLKGKVGTGIRAAWVGEKTTTSFVVYVLVRNMSSEAYNFIHETNLTDVGTRLTKTTDVTIGARIVGGADQFVSGVNLENDPLVYSDADSRNWSGLRIRRFEFTGLSENTEYTVEAYTDAVDQTDFSLGKLQTCRWKVKTFSSDSFAGLHASCDNNAWSDPTVDGAITRSFLGQDAWYAVADHCIKQGADIIASQDDLSYALTPLQRSSGIKDWESKWADPVNLTTDVVDLSACCVDGVRLRDAELTTEEALVGAYGTAYSLVYNFFIIILRPSVLSVAMRIGMESTDSGDHVALLNNTCIHLADNYYLGDAFLVDYGCTDSELAQARPADTATLHWLHGGLNDDPVADPYDNGSACYENTKTDLQSCAQMTANHLVLFEYFFGRATGVQPPQTPAWREMYSDHPEFGTTLALNSNAARPIWRKREHPLVDIFYLNCTYYGDQGYVGGDEAQNYPANYRVIELDRDLGKRLGTAQLSWLQSEIAASTKDYIVIYIGDPIQPVDPLLTFSGTYGQPDSLGQIARAEMQAMIASLEALTDKGVLVLTGDHHSLSMNRAQPNILQLLSVIGWGPALRPFTVDTQALYGFEGQYEDAQQTIDGGAERQRGLNFFKLTAGRMYAYNVRSEIGFPLASDIAYFDRGDNQWRFIVRGSNTNNDAVGVGDSLAALKGD